MNYKEFGLRNYLSIQGLYDNYQISSGENDYISQDSNESLKDAVEKFEVLMAVYNNGNKLANNCIKKLKINSEDDYNNELKKVLRELNNFSCYLPISDVERIFNSIFFFEYMQIFIKITEDEKKNDPEDYHQDSLSYALHIILNCAKRSNSLCEKIILRGILLQITEDINFYSKFCKYTSYSIFAEIFNKKNFGQKGFREFVKCLAEKHLTKENYDDDEIETSQISQLLFSFNGYDIIYSETEKEKEYRKFISEKAFLILNEGLGNCTNSALKGINDLINFCDWFFLENPYLIVDILNFLSKQPDEKRATYIIIILISLYEKLNKLKDNKDELYEQFDNIFAEATENNIDMILHLINYPNIYTINLYSIIINTYPKILESFANQDFLGSLYDILDDGKCELKMVTLLFISSCFKTQNAEFINAFFKNIIGNLFICSLSLVDPEDENLQEMILGLLAASDINSALIFHVLNNCEDFEDLRNIYPSNEKTQFLLGNLFERYDSSL